MTSQLVEGVAPSFTEEEKAYFDNRGNAPAQQQIEEDDSEAMDLVEADDGDEDEGAEVELDESEDEAEAEAEKPKKQVVPIKALHKEREARKQLDERLRQADMDRVRLEERMNSLLERMQPQQQQPEAQAEPDFDNDPFAAAQAAYAKQQSLEQKLAQFEQAQQVKAQEEQIRQFTEHHEREFMKQAPDYLDAVTHLKAGREAELRMLGYNDQVVKTVLLEEANQIVWAAAQSGKSPAELAYTIAKQRGYAPKSQERAPIEAKPSTKSLSQASGTASGTKLTAQDILRMSPDEFSRFAEKNPKKFRQIMGG